MTCPDHFGQDSQEDAKYNPRSLWIPGSTRSLSSGGAERRPVGVATERRTSRCNARDQTRMPGVRSLHPCDHREPLDALIAEGIEEGVVILERDAAVGVAVRAQHVGVREQ